MAIAVPAAHAVTYVSPSGDNTTGTSWATALHSLSAAVEAVRQDSARQGDRRIWVAEGAYEIADVITIPGAAAIYGGFPDTGAATFEQRDPARFHSVLIPAEADADSPLLRIFAANSIVFDGFHLQGQDVALDISQGDNITVENCWWTDAFHTVLSVNDTDGLHVRNVHVDWRPSEQEQTAAVTLSYSRSFEMQDISFTGCPQSLLLSDSDGAIHRAHFADTSSGIALVNGVLTQLSDGAFEACDTGVSIINGRMEALTDTAFEGCGTSIYVGSASSSQQSPALYLSNVAITGGDVGVKASNYAVLALRGLQVEGVEEGVVLSWGRDTASIEGAAFENCSTAISTSSELPLSVKTSSIRNSERGIHVRSAALIAESLEVYDVEHPVEAESSSKLTITNSAFVGSRDASIRLDSSDLTMYNCTLVASASRAGAVSHWGYRRPFQGILANNVFAVDGGVAVSAPIEELQLYDNLFSEGAIPLVDEEGRRLTVDEINTMASAEGNISAAPGLRRGDYHLAASSPAIDAARSDIAPPEDIDQELRQAPVDIGADEFVDIDGNGLADWWEAQFERPLGSASDDSDGDSLSNGEEYTLATNPLNAETDGDGVADGVEVARGTDPADRQGDPVYVRASQSAGSTTDGESWETAFAALSDGLNKALAEGRPVWLAAGTYTGAGSFEVAERLEMAGGFPANGGFVPDWSPQEHRTVIKPGVHVPLIEGADGATVVVAGIDFAAPEPAYVSIDAPVIAGGFQSVVQLIDCALYGFQHFPLLSASAASAILLERSSFFDNVQPGRYNGDPLVQVNGYLSVRDCNFSKTRSAGSLLAAGSYEVARTIFAENSLRGVLGRVMTEPLRASFMNCAFVGNSNTEGGDFLTLPAQSVLQHCTFSYNRVDYGELISPSHDPYSGEEYPTQILGCIIAFNTSGESIGLASGSIVEDTIVYGNAVDDPYAEYLEGAKSLGVIERDPMLAPGGFHLMPGSPAIDAMDALAEVDIAGEPRPIDIAGIGNEGEAIADIGADEYLDADGNGYPDWWEAQYGGNLDYDADPDGDSLTTAREFALQTDPFARDTDGDGMDDAWEAAHGTNPRVDDAEADPDDDGLINIEEYEQGTDPLNPEPGAAAADLKVNTRLLTLSQAAPSASFRIENAGHGELAWAATSADDALLITPPQGNGSSNVTVFADAFGAERTVDVTVSNAADPTDLVVVQVRLMAADETAEPAQLAVGTASITVAPTSETATFEVQNLGEMNLEWVILNDDPTLQVQPQSGINSRTVAVTAKDFSAARSVVLTVRSLGSPHQEATVAVQILPEVSAVGCHAGGSGAAGASDLLLPALAALLLAALQLRRRRKPLR